MQEYFILYGQVYKKYSYIRCAHLGTTVDWLKLCSIRRVVYGFSTKLLFFLCVENQKCDGSVNLRIYGFIQSTYLFFLSIKGI
jgi:hypothetical protein